MSEIVKDNDHSAFIYVRQSGGGKKAGDQSRVAEDMADWSIHIDV